MRKPAVISARQVEHYDARTVDEAITILKNNGDKACIIAGGTDLIHRIKKEVILPEILINIKSIQGMNNITEEEGGIRIGSLTTIHDIESSELINSKYRILADAAYSVAAPQLRNMATLGGNLCQEVWCWYYRRSPVTGKSFICFRKGGNKCFAATGNNSQHAIISEGKCRAAFPSDMAPPLIALGAVLTIYSAGGKNEIPLEEFYTDMGNVLKSDEIITDVKIPYLKPGTQQRFTKFRFRKTIDFAISSVSTVIIPEQDIVKDAAIVLGCIAPTPYRAISAEQYLSGKKITENVAEKAALLALDNAKPLSMNRYKIPITETLIRDSLL